MKEITIAVPEGKEAIWAEDGKLTLVDATPEQEPKQKDNRPAIERIKTFEDACNELGEHHPLVVNYTNMLSVATREEFMTGGWGADFVAYAKLRIITAALNEGWEPKFTEDEERWYPWHIFWTEEELANKSEEWKDGHQLLLWGGAANDGAYAGLAYACSYGAFSDTDANCGSRLACKTEAVADFCGRQFIQIWSEFYTEKEWKPWRNS